MKEPESRGVPSYAIPLRLRGGWLKPWKPGQSGNPAGRKKSGASIKEWVSSLVHRQVTPDELMSIAKDPTKLKAQRIAATRLLMFVGIPDMADFSDWFEGKKTLTALKAEGADMGSIKRATERWSTRGRIREVTRSMCMRDINWKEIEALLGLREQESLRFHERTSHERLPEHP